ncbi:DUF5011 domain-containing protein [bacterium AH-315-C20]|nr:DUF5011 domain-containing protein [bacterium AH-315-C20]
MQNYLLLTLAILFIATSCKKDSTQPVITLNGSPEQVVALNDTYMELGATAKDDKDGDVTDRIVISGSIDVNQTGEYRIYYDCDDNKGNKAATATRFVNVVNEADYMLGTYLAEPSCVGTATTSSYNTTITASDKLNNRIYIKRVLWSVEDEPVFGDVSGGTMNIPLQTIGGNTVEGTATLSGSTFSLSVQINDGVTYDCTISHTKL